MSPKARIRTLAGRGRDGVEGYVQPGTKPGGFTRWTTFPRGPCGLSPVLPRGWMEKGSPWVSRRLSLRGRTEASGPVPGHALAEILIGSRR